MSSPLRQKKILVTREAAQAEMFSEKIKTSGGIPIEAPLLKITCKRSEHIDKSSSYEWIFFTSANGVDCYLDNMKEPLTSKIAVVGEKTGFALKKYGLEADFIPTIYTAEVMVIEFIKENPHAGPILLVRGNRARPTLLAEFTQYGFTVDTAEVYETLTHTSMQVTLNKALLENDIDFLTFTSPSTIDAFIELIADFEAFEQKVCVCIGTTTADYARAQGFTQILIPEVFTIEGMIDQIDKYIREKG